MITMSKNTKLYSYTTSSSLYITDVTNNIFLQCLTNKNQIIIFMNLSFKSCSKFKNTVTNQSCNNTGFYICTYIYFTRDLYFFKYFWVLCPFISTWRTPFSISCRADLVVMNSFSFCLFRNFLISSLLLKGKYDIYSIIDVTFFQDFKQVIPYCLWLPKFLMRNHFIILLKQIYTWCVTSLLLLSRLSLCLWPLTVDYI